MTPPALRSLPGDGDHGFQRIDRHTDQSGTRLSVPIQSSVARLGLAVRF